MTSDQAAPVETYVLSGKWLHLLTEGTELGDNPKASVNKAVGRLILSAIRTGTSREYVLGLLLDRKRYKLAEQLGTGRKGRMIPVAQTRRHLEKVWLEKSQFAATTPAWNRDDALEFIEFVRDNAPTEAQLQPTELSIFEAVLELATAYGSTTPVVPSRVLADMTGLDKSKANRGLRRLADRGEWLGPHLAGNHKTRRASTYKLAPALLRDFTPTSQLAQLEDSAPQHQPTGQEPHMDGITLTASPAALAQLLEISSGGSAELRRAVEQLTGQVVPAKPQLRLVTSEAE